MASCKYSDSDSISIQSLIPLNLSKTHLHSQEPTNSNIQRLTEEAKIEREITKAITSGKPESLKPNSGEAIYIGEHYVCVSFHEEKESDCRVWEWHGHVVSYSEGRGYTQEYVYGSYFERMMKKVVVSDDEDEGESEQEKGIGLGLREFIGGMNLMDGRVFCRNFTDNSRRI